MPEKSGMDAVLDVLLLAGPTLGVTSCPHAGAKPISGNPAMAMIATLVSMNAVRRFMMLLQR
jgi:hypothetical protein